MLITLNIISSKHELIEIDFPEIHENITGSWSGVSILWKYVLIFYIPYLGKY